MLVLELPDGTSVGFANVEGDESDGVWWIKANQGHSISVRPTSSILVRLIDCIKMVKVEMKPILKLDDIPTKLAIHGTTRDAWNIIQKEGLSKMKRNHIHLAQGVAGGNIISGTHPYSTTYALDSQLFVGQE